MAELRRDSAVLDGVVAEAELDISIDKVEKLDAPLLVIGLGGTGSEMVHAIRRTFAKRYVLPKNSAGHELPAPKSTAYLVLDSDPASQGVLGANEFLDISLPGLDRLLATKERSLTAYELTWVNKHMNSTTTTQGASTYRQAARLMLCRNFNKVSASITALLTSVVAVTHGHAATNSKVTIVIAGGISGGTGSGTFLDVAQIVRHCMESNPMLLGKPYQIMGYLVMPDISKLKLPATHPLQSAFDHNAYAALKELDFWMGYETNHNTAYTMQYTTATGIKWRRPFDSCTLLCGTTTAGVAFANPMDMVNQTVAETLLHYFADETVKNDDEGRPEYTFISYENNLQAAVPHIPKSTPSNYCYRAIGAFSMVIPKRQLLFKEGEMLFQRFVPLRTPMGTLPPVTTLIDRGQSTQDASTIAGNLQNMYSTFKTVVNLPAFCNFDTRDEKTVNSLRNMNPAPHDQLDVGVHPWQSSVLKPGGMVSSEQYFEAAWERFNTFVKKAMVEHDVGPFGLKAYMECKDAGGLLTRMKELLTNWEGTANNFAGGIEHKRNECLNTWGAFCKPPRPLGERKALEAYRQALITFFDAHRLAVFAREFTTSLKKLIRRMEEYLEQSLTTLCEGLDRIDKGFNGDAGVGAAAAELYTVDQALEDRLDAAFNQNGPRAVTDFKNALCIASLVTMPSADPETTGVVFPFAKTSLSEIRKVLRDKLNDCFSTINNASMDMLLQQQVGNDVAAQQKAMDELKDQFMTNAMPMFSLNAVHVNDPRAEYIFLSIPKNSTSYIKHYETALNNQADVKASEQLDHLYCLTSYDGMPVHRYSVMDAIERSYESDVLVPAQSMGMHLVWNGEVDADVTDNWTKLPSPAPFYFFGGQPSHRARTHFESILEKVQRAKASGMLEIQYNQIPTFSYTLKYNDDTHTTLKPAAYIMDEMAAIRNQRDPATNEPISETVELGLLEEYVKAGFTQTKQPGCSPGCMALYLGLVGRPINPHDPGIMGNPAALKEAQENHRKLCDAFVAAILAADPYEWQKIEKQLEGMEAVQARIREIREAKDRWTPRIDYAPTAANMYVYGLLRTNSGMSMYRMDEESVPLFHDALMKPDAAGLSQYAKALAYMADMPQDNRVRQDLDFRLQNAKKQVMDDIVRDTFTKERREELQSNAKRTMDALTGELKGYNEEARKFGADHQTLGQIIAMLNEAIGALSRICEGEGDFS